MSLDGVGMNLMPTSLLKPTQLRKARYHPHSRWDVKVRSIGNQATLPKAFS